MKLPSCVAAGALVLFVVGCSVGEKRGGEGALAFEPKRFERTEGTCDSPDSACARLVLSFPLFTSETAGPVTDSLNHAIDAWILGAINEGTRPGTPESLAAQFLESYRDVVRAFPGYRLPWHLERTAVVSSDFEGIVCLKFAENSYTGGAHPNASTLYRSIERATGRTLNLDDIVKRGMRGALNNLAEQQFRAVRKLQENENLAAAGFWFGNGGFNVNNNFCLTARGLTFYFNPYEIAPYAAGPTEILIPLNNVKNLIDLSRISR